MYARRAGGAMPALAVILLLHAGAAATSVAGAAPVAGVSPSAADVAVSLLEGLAPGSVTDVPAPFQDAAADGLRKCGTHLLSEYLQVRDALEPATTGLIDAYLARASGELEHLSPSGRFRLTYDLQGEDAVPAVDVDPANGVPDFIERAAAALDEAWRVMVTESGFAAPVLDGGPIEVGFQDMGFYGYTVPVDSGTGRVRLVLHATFEGFPGNDDPDGDVAGAARVTAAHELRHASQFVASRWSEGGWVELDAVWAEELVFDQVNDYRNYMLGNSPIRRPDLPLDYGPGGTGSYDDAVFQLWLQQTWGLAVVRDFWRRRAEVTGEDYLQTWDAVLAERGASLAAGWGQFTAWNHATGSRAAPQVGYEESATYPSSSLRAVASSYPFQFSASLERLSAAAVRLQGLGAADEQRLRLRFEGHDAGGPLSLSVYLQWRDGSGQIVPVELDAANDADWTLDAPASGLLAAGVVVGNPLRWGLARPWSLAVELEPIPPAPALAVAQARLTPVLAAGGSGETSLTLSNAGAPGSELRYLVRLWQEDPDAAAPAGGEIDAGKSIAGTTIVAQPGQYLPGEESALLVAVTNRSQDDEWLTDVDLDFPAGVTVLSTTDFVGGSLGRMVSDGSQGQGVRVHWHGVDPVYGTGVVRSGETAVAEVRLRLAADFSGDMVAVAVIDGDGYSASPHTLRTELRLTPGDPRLALQAPAAGAVHDLSDSLLVAWTSRGLTADVEIDLSRDGGQSWTLLGAARAADGQARFAAPGEASGRCLARVRTADGAVQAVSAGMFALLNRSAWLSCFEAEGRLAAGESHTLDLALDGAGLEPGLHRAWITVEELDGADRVVLPVVVEVTGRVPPATVRVSNIHPNPFNPATRITVEVSGATPLDVAIVDARGAVVRRLRAVADAAGAVEVPWDGTDEQGRLAPAGLYLVRVRADGGETARKMTLVR
jgi:hypothetical protein